MFCKISQQQLGSRSCKAFTACRSHKRAFACRATAGNPEPTPSTSEAASSSGTIFYAGTAYTESEWQAALKSGSVSADGIPVTRTAVTNSTLDSLVEVMAFSGPAPEIANGRLAMLGFVSALGAELASGQGVITQWQQAETPIALTFVLFMAASLVPFLKGAQKEALGPFTPEAELLNGRAAMIGFASLLIAEGIRGVALF